MAGPTLPVLLLVLLSLSRSLALKEGSIDCKNGVTGSGCVPPVDCRAVKHNKSPPCKNAVCAQVVPGTLGMSCPLANGGTVKSSNTDCERDSSATACTGMVDCSKVYNSLTCAAASAGGAACSKVVPGTVAACPLVDPACVGKIDCQNDKKLDGCKQDVDCTAVCNSSVCDSADCNKIKAGTLAACPDNSGGGNGGGSGNGNNGGSGGGNDGGNGGGDGKCPGGKAPTIDCSIYWNDNDCKKSEADTDCCKVCNDKYGKCGDVCEVDPKNENCCANCYCDGSNCHDNGNTNGPHQHVWAKCEKLTATNSEWAPVEFPTFPHGLTGDQVRFQCQCTANPGDYIGFNNDNDQPAKGAMFYCGTYDTVSYQ